MTASRPPLRRVCVLIPTYNEAASLPGVVARLRTAVPDVDVLVLDDNSPDGTGRLADAIAATDSQVHVMHRPGKAGLGKAYLAGFRWAAERGYDAVVEMDADGSHLPEQLPALLAAAAEADVVIGSRWVPGGAIHHWPATRKALSLAGNLYARTLLGIRVQDATGGYRVYRVDALRQMGLEDVASAGYCFQIDLTLRAVDRGLAVTEVPIDFVERETGQSKMGRPIVVEALRRVTAWGLARRAQQLRSAGSRLRTGEQWHQLAD
jgi:dolichol-phosphate mannosyltransferase